MCVSIRTLLAHFNFTHSQYQWWELLWEPFNGGPDWVSEQTLAMKGLDVWRSRVRNDPALGSKSIIQLMASTSEGDRFFSPFGRHLLNDSLHFLGWFPGMPGHIICNSDDLFNQFKTGLVLYLNQYETTSFIRKCCTRSNSENFLEFQSSADEYYSTAHMKVFRKAVVSVPVELYNRMTRAGLLDPNHRIGILLSFV